MPLFYVILIATKTITDLNYKFIKGGNIMSEDFSSNKEAFIFIPAEVQTINGEKITRKARIENFGEFLEQEALKTGDITIFEARLHY